jgi:hypothetical protein
MCLFPDVPVPRCACSQAPEVNIKDRSSDLLASAVFVNDVDALSPLSIPLHEGEENSVLVTGRTEKHTKTSAARHVATSA